MSPEHTKQDIFVKIFLSSSIILEGIIFSDKKKLFEIQQDFIAMPTMYMQSKNDKKSMIFINKSSIQAMQLTIPKNV